MASITKWSIVTVRPTQGQHKQQSFASFRVQGLIPREKGLDALSFSFTLPWK